VSVFVSHTALHAHKLHVHSSQGCFLCISAGYIECSYPAHDTPPDYTSIWWQEGEDGSKYDRRSDPDYIELLDLGFEKEGDEVEISTKWEEWEGYLNSLAIGWKERLPNIHSYRPCGRHKLNEVLRIHRYMLKC
jgi:hypothetical protein